MNEEQGKYFVEILGVEAYQSFQKKMREFDEQLKNPVEEVANQEGDNIVYSIAVDRDISLFTLSGENINRLLPQDWRIVYLAKASPRTWYIKRFITFDPMISGLYEIIHEIGHTQTTDEKRQSVSLNLLRSGTSGIEAYIDIILDKIKEDQGKLDKVVDDYNAILTEETQASDKGIQLMKELKLSQLLGDYKERLFSALYYENYQAYFLDIVRIIKRLRIPKDLLAKSVVMIRQNTDFRTFYDLITVKDYSVQELVKQGEAGFPKIIKGEGYSATVTRPLD